MIKKKAFRSSLLRWYRGHGRDLPWRRTRDPYAILVSEFMLQQTQVAAVRSYYNEWLERFPDFAALARASENDVLRAWQGLGYYARARNLHATAKLIVDRHRGRLPESIEQMRQLPGIGKYTAHAIASFAFEQSVPIVETNTARVLARLFNLRTPIDQTAGRKALWNHATSLLPRKRTSIYNSALVDLGALICLPRPKCAVCPVKKFCRAPNPEALPLKQSRPRTEKLIEHHALVVRENKILLEQSAARWRGMWILPRLKTTIRFASRPACNHSAKLTKLDRLKQSSFHKLVHSSFFPFTHHRVQLCVYPRAPVKIDERSQRWFDFGALESIPIPSPHRRAIAALLPNSY
jgi:A/G-specific adenine glycosylase